MKTLISTQRGSLKIVQNTSLSSKFKSTIFLDWPYAKGYIFNEGLIDTMTLYDGFIWSIERDFIEEDASIHAVMIARGKLRKKIPIDSIFTSSLIPSFLPKSIYDNLIKNGSSNSIRPEFFKNHFKRLNNINFGIYPIVENLTQLETLMNSGVKIIQLRIKNEESKKIESIISEACKLSSSYINTQLFINDYWHLAIKYGAYGVHLGQEDLLNSDIYAISNAGVRLGISTHSFWEVSCALKFHPSYIAIGPVFPTSAKKMPWLTQGIKNLKYWRELIDVPIVAIGGISKKNMLEVKKTKVNGVSMINSILSKENIAQAYKDLNNIWCGFEK